MALGENMANEIINVKIKKEDNDSEKYKIALKLINKILTIIVFCMLIILTYMFDCFTF